MRGSPSPDRPTSSALRIPTQIAHLDLHQSKINSSTFESKRAHALRLPSRLAQRRQ
jgi:hypothetical protein